LCSCAKEKDKSVVTTPSAAERDAKITSVRMERAGQALAKLNLSSAIAADELAFAAWTAAVGKRIARHAPAIALVRGRLIVEAEDAVWQQQLFHLRFDILAKFSQVLGGGIVTDLEFRVSKPARRPPQAAQSHGENRPADEADAIEDPVMRIVYKQSRAKSYKTASKASA